MTKRELRAVGLSSAGQGTATLAGFIPYGQPADIGPFTETLAPLALRAASDVLALYAHDSRQLLGRTSSGTLKLDNQALGLAVEFALPDTQLGRDVRELTARGDLRGLSFGMEVTEDEWADGRRKRLIRAAVLHEVSVVPLPFYSGTTLTARSDRSGEGTAIHPRRYLARLSLDLFAR